MVAVARKPGMPSEDRQPTMHAGIRGGVMDYVFRDALPANLREVWNICFLGTASDQEAARELDVHPSFIRWAKAVLQRRFDQYAHMLHNNDFTGAAKRTREEAAEIVNRPGQNYVPARNIA